jgi:cobalt-zinc-cadmium resistance protein CzcA
MEGVILVVLVLILFLGSWRSAALVAITIPISLLIAFVLMKLTNIPANLLSLGAIDFGIIVDGAIVMMETILKKREDHPEAELDTLSIRDRVLEVSKPIMFSSIIIITAYLPLFAFERIEKKLFTPMAFTVGYALLGALAVAIFLIPGLAYTVYRKPQKTYKNRWLETLTEKYNKITETLLAKPKRVLTMLIIATIGALTLTIMVGKDFLPQLDEGSIWLQVQLPPGISLDRSKLMSDTLRRRMMKFPEVTYVMVQNGRDDEGAESFSTSHIECSIGLKPYSEWKSGKRKSDLIKDMENELSTMPGYTVGFSQPIIDMVMDQIAGAHSDLAVKIYGEDIAETRRIAEQVVGIVTKIKGAEDVIIDQEPPAPQLQILADRDKIAQYGLNVSDVSELIEVAIGGKAISQVFIGNKSYDVICRYNEASRSTPESIGSLLLTSADGSKIPLSQVSEIKMTTGASAITREMNKRHLTVRINLRDIDLTAFLKEAQSKIESNINYDREKYQIRWGGQFENQNRAYTRLMIIVPIALAIMFILLYGAFGQLRQASMLMGIAPIALFGGMLALNLRGMTLNVSSAVGFIALLGVAIQNGVIMISHINNLRKRGMELRRAVVTGARHRFRPVLMTATVAVLGLLPASFSTDIGSDVQRPLATVIVYGLLFATVITLFALPTVYYEIEKRMEKKNAVQ